jgi:hypothetical protein
MSNAMDYHFVEEHDEAATARLGEILDRITCKIITSIIDSPKTPLQICHENKLPLSSTYKRIRKLYDGGLISIEKINIDNKGKKIVLYRSKIKSFEFNLNRDRISLKFNRNNEFRQ